MSSPDRAQRGRRLLKIGVIWHVVGCGPLYAVILLSSMGIGDPNSNPVGFGILAFFSFWPSLGLIVIGAAMMRPKKQV